MGRIGRGKEGVAGFRAAALILAVILLSSCQARPASVKPRLEDEGAIYVYIRPLPQDADRVTFRLEGVSATRGDGRSFPLSLHVSELGGKAKNRERLLASGELPPGEYEGLAFRLKSATLKGEEGEIALLPVEEISRTKIPFVVAKKRAVVLSLQFRYRESVLEGFRFAPSFAAGIPGKIPSGAIGLVSNPGANTVTMFDKQSGQVVAVIPTGAAPYGLALDQSLRKAYVAISGEDSIETVDLLEATVIDGRRLNAGDNPAEVALSPDGKTLLSANSGSGTVSFIEAATLIERNRVQVGVGPQSILVDRAGRRAYVFNTLSNTISVIDMGSEAVAATVATESGPVKGQFNRAGNRLYVLHRDSPFLNVIDPVSLSIVRRINIGGGGTALKVDNRTDLLYLFKRFGNEIDIYDPFSFLPIDFIRTGGEVAHMVIDGDRNTLLIVFPASGILRTLRLVGGEAISEIEVGGNPFQVAVMGEK